MDKNMEEHCQFYVVRKKRYCRMTLRAGSKYCGEHEPKVETPEDGNQNVRIPCPLDPKHTCYANKLEKHLKICNAKQGESLPYISKNCNVLHETESNKEQDPPGKRCLSNVSENVVKEVIQLVEKIYDEIISGNISPYPEKECHPSVVEDIDNDGRKDRTRRHLLQTSSLLYIVESQDLMTPNTSFVELGAGKGHLSYYLSKTVNNIPNCSVVLVDRASHRHKQDNKLGDDCSVKVNRIRADISDLVLAKVPAVQSSSSLVAVSKHLCGAATDLAVRCLTKSDVIDKAAGLVMATCCHHRCIWDIYVGKTFLQAKSVTKSLFDVMCGLVSWATCGSGLSRERRHDLESDISLSKEPKRSKLDNESDEIDIENEIRNSAIENVDPHTESLTDDNINEKIYEIANDLARNPTIKPENVIPNNNSENTLDKTLTDEAQNDKKNNFSLSKNLGLSIKQREDIGFKAKAVIDWGRMVYLKDNGFLAHLCFYVDKSLSPENVCIVATRGKI